MAQLFEKTQKTLIFVPICPNINLPLRLNSISFCGLKIFSHMEKNERSNVEISRKTVNRPLDEQTINAFENPYTIYGIVSQEVSSLFIKYLSAFFYNSFLKNRPSSLQQRNKSIYGIITLHYNHHHMNRKIDTHFSY